MEEFCEKQRDPNEPGSHWSARKQFIVNNWDRYHGNQLVSLAMVWSNMEFHGCTYPAELMNRVQEMARGITVDDTLMDVDNKPNITVSRSQPVDKHNPKPTPGVISTTDTFQPVKRSLEEEREGSKFQKTAKRLTLKEKTNMRCDSSLGKVDITKVEQSKSNKITCQANTISEHDKVISALAENLRRQPTMKKSRPLSKLHAAATKLSLKRHVELIDVRGVIQDMHGKSKMSNPRWLCNLYMDDVLLASAEAENKHASRVCAGKKALSMLESSDFAVKNVNKVSSLGKSYSKEIVPLHQPTTTPSNVRTQVLDSFTLIEPALNPAPAVSVLVNSAFKNQVSIEFKTRTNASLVNGITNHLCQTIISGVIVATGIHENFREARNVSAQNALALLRKRACSSQMKKNNEDMRIVISKSDTKMSDSVKLESKASNSPKLENKVSDSTMEPDSKVPDSVQKKPPGKVKHAPIGESNIGHKLLKLMGWEGGALQKDGIIEPIEASEKFCRGGLGFVDTSSKGNNKKRKQLKKCKKKSKAKTGVKNKAIQHEYKKYLDIDEEKCNVVQRPKTFELESVVEMLQSFAQSDKEDLIFSSAFTQSERKSIHRIASGFKLRSNSYGKRNERRLVIRRKCQIL